MPFLKWREPCEESTWSSEAWGPSWGRYAIVSTPTSGGKLICGLWFLPIGGIYQHPDGNWSSVICDYQSLNDLFLTPEAAVALAEKHYTDNNWARLLAAVLDEAEEG